MLEYKSSSTCNGERAFNGWASSLGITRANGGGAHKTATNWCKLHTIRLMESERHPLLTTAGVAVLNSDSCFIINEKHCVPIRVDTDHPRQTNGGDGAVAVVAVWWTEERVKALRWRPWRLGRPGTWPRSRRERRSKHWTNNCYYTLEITQPNLQNLPYYSWYVGYSHCKHKMYI